MKKIGKKKSAAFLEIADRLLKKKGFREVALHPLEGANVVNFKKYRLDGDFPAATLENPHPYPENWLEATICVEQWSLLTIYFRFEKVTETMQHCALIGATGKANFFEGGRDLIYTEGALRRHIETLVAFL